MTQAYPLLWPHGRSRRDRYELKIGRFTQDGRCLTVAQARRRLVDELARIGAENEILSSNIELRLDGSPHSGRREPDDRAVCLYFDLEGEPVAMPCDTYTEVADNIAAVASHIEATRKIERHGVASVKEMFTGFAALPSPGAKKTWREIFGAVSGSEYTLSKLTERYRELAKRRHPDSPTGSNEKMQELVSAFDEAKMECV